MAKGKRMPRRRGRPPLPPKKGKRFPLSLRTTEGLKELLRDASDQSGRSIAQEVELRLVQSFDDQISIDDLLEMTFGAKSAGALMLFGTVFNYANALSARQQEPHWLDDHVGFDIVAAALQKILHKLRPGGETKFHATRDDRARFIEERADSIARATEWTFLGGQDTASRSRNLLGPEIRDRVSARTVRPERESKHEGEDR